MRIAIILLLASFFVLSPFGLTQAQSPYYRVDTLVNDRSTDTYPAITQSETSIASVGDTVVVGWNDTSTSAVNCSGLGYGRSTDSGGSWTDHGSILPGGPAARAHGDPVLAANHLGDFFYAALAQEASPASEPCGGDFPPIDATDGRSFVGVWRSTDDGSSFSFLADASPGTGAANFQDKEEMAIDTNAGSAFQGRMYVCWAEVDPNLGVTNIRVSALDSTTGTVVVSSTILASASVLGPGPEFVQGCAVAVAPGASGRVYVAWGRAPVSVTIFPTVSISLVPGSVGSVEIISSDDGGASWSSVVEAATGAVAGDPSVDCTVSRGNYNLRPAALKGSVRDAPIPTLAVSPDGQVNVAATVGIFDAGSGAWLGDIQYARSSDGGASWSSPATINDDSTNDQFQPRLTARSDGSIAMIWYDRRHDPANLRIHVREAVSFDAGGTWHGFEVTDTDFGLPPLDPNFGGGDCYMGDYNAIVSDADQYFLAWGDNRLDTSTYPSGPATNHPDPDIRFESQIAEDIDGDGFSNGDEMYIATGPTDPCGTDGWAPDIIDGVLLPNGVDIQDLTDYIVPDRYFGTDIAAWPGQEAAARRHDIAPGPGFPGSTDIDVLDLTLIVTITPPMLGGERAFGSVCPWPG